MSCYSKPSPDAMNEYNKKVEFLKGLIETQKMVRWGSMFWNFKMGICCCIQIRKNIVIETTRKCLSSENISQIILYIICMLSILLLVASKRGHETKKHVLIGCLLLDITCFAAKHLKFDSLLSKLSRQR